MFEIDGSQKTGSGTILRLAIAISAIKKEPLHITNIRQNRPKPGLKPQHLEAVITAAKLCNGEIQGANPGSRELWFKPNEIKGGTFEAEIGTAGSIPMLFMTILPICLYAKNDVQVRVSQGGTDTTHAPSINYFQNVLLTSLRRMGVEAKLTVQRYGYYPKGNGEATLLVKPTQKITSLQLDNFGNLKEIKGISVCTFLQDRKVAERQAQAATKLLAGRKYSSEIKIVNDNSNPIQKGSSITIWAETDSNAVLGADALGDLRKTSELVGSEAAEKLALDLEAQATVDVHLADMLIPYVALAKDSSVFLTRNISEHLQANIWIAEKMLNAKFIIRNLGELYRVEKLAEK